MYKIFQKLCWGFQLSTNQRVKQQIEPATINPNMSILLLHIIFHITMNGRFDQPHERKNYNGCFQRSANDIILKTFSDVCQQKLAQIQNYKQKFRRETQQQARRNPNFQSLSSSRISLDPRRSDFEHFIRQDQFHHEDSYNDLPNHYGGRHPPIFHQTKHQSINSIKRQIDNLFVEIEQRIGENNDFKTFKNKGKQYIQAPLAELSFQVQKQYKSLKQYKNKSKEFYLGLFGDNIKAQKKVDQRKKQVFENMQKIINRTIQKYSQQKSSIQREINNIQESYFNYIRYQLVKIALEQQLPNHGTINYEKIKSQTIHKRIRLPLSGNNTSSMYRTVFSDKSFTGLQQGNWLHNSVIDNYIQYLKYTQGYNDPSRSQYAIFSFSESKNFELAESYRFTSGPIFTRFQRVGLVINVKDQHWFFIGVIPKKGKFIIYDSISKKSQNYAPYLKGIRNFVKLQERQFGLPEGSIVLTQIDEDTTPSQVNGSDCGLHVIWNLTCFLKPNENRNQKIDFSQYNIRYLRAALYHFMAYLLYLSRQNNPTPNYDWLEFSSRSVILEKNGIQMWK